MPITPKEAIDLGIEGEQIVEVLVKALRRDVDGKVRITKEERKEISQRLIKFAKHLVHDIAT